MPDSRAQGQVTPTTLSSTDAVVIVLGVVIGAGIFRTPPLVAAQSSSVSAFLALWAAGGVISLAGALCYAELAATYPDAGGDYHFLRRAYGVVTGSLFAWARLTVIQSGSIAMLGFLIGDYAAELFHLGSRSTPLLAGAAVALLTFLNAAGLRKGSLAQKALVAALLGGLLLTMGLGLTGEAAAAAPAPAPSLSVSGLGTAMIFVLLTYGGWNEAAYLSAEIPRPRRRMAPILMVSVGLITLLYLLFNLVAVRALGLAGLAASQAPALELLRRSAGELAAAAVSVIVILAALSTMNASIITGARTVYAVARDLWPGGSLGRRAPAGTPVAATLLQGGLSLALVGLGSAWRSGFVAMVEYTAPVFWLFFLLVGIALPVLRHKDRDRPRGFRVPLYPLTPLVFVAVSGFMLQASLVHVGRGALVGVAVLLAGLPLAWMTRGRAGSLEADPAAPPGELTGDIP